MFSKQEREGVNVVPWNTEEADPAGPRVRKDVASVIIQAGGFWAGRELQ